MAVVSHELGTSLLSTTAWKMPGSRSSPVAFLTKIQRPGRNLCDRRACFRPRPHGGKVLSRIEGEARVAGLPWCFQPERLRCWLSYQDVYGDACVSGERVGFAMIIGSQIRPRSFPDRPIHVKNPDRRADTGVYTSVPVAAPCESRPIHRRLETQNHMEIALLFSAETLEEVRIEGST